MRPPPLRPTHAMFEFWLAAIAVGAGARARDVLCPAPRRVV